MHNTFYSYTDIISRQCTCVLETQWCSLVLLVWTVNNSIDHVHSFHSINHVKTIVTMQFFKLELVNVTRLDN